MTAVLDEAAVQLDQGQDQALVAFNYHIVIEILGLQMTKELWHYMILCPITSSPNVCVADLYWDQVLDQDGNPNMKIISLIFYEYCQKALNHNLNRTGDAAVIKIYRRIGCLHGPPLMDIQEVGCDLGYIRDFNVYGIDKDGNRRRANIGALIRSYDHPPSQGAVGAQFLQPPIDDSFFQALCLHLTMQLKGSFRLALCCNRSGRSTTYKSPGSVADINQGSDGPMVMQWALDQASWFVQEALNVSMPCSCQGHSNSKVQPLASSTRLTVIYGENPAADKPNWSKVFQTRCSRLCKLLYLEHLEMTLLEESSCPVAVVHSQRMSFYTNLDMTNIDTSDPSPL
ncbi:hypothetical protein F4604DRAFT_1678599 [Suillus subluteus]|nr:hypothetical protein F4604DRAFT_1678599 [Suillus subluteus]